MIRSALYYVVGALVLVAFLPIVALARLAR